MTSAIPTTLGAYRLTHRVGAGGMAEVYVAERVVAGGLSKRVALKRIRPAWAADTEARRLFVKEAALALSLAHPNLVSVHGYEEIGNELFLVMEYIEGVNLARLKAAPLTPGEVAYVAVQALHALDYLHTRPEGAVLHRDISPSNLLVDGYGQVKLVDVGIARPLSDTPQTLACGTWRYAAPEQRTAAPLGPACDLFSLALTLFELSGVVLPVNVENEAALLACWARLDPASPFQPLWERLRGMAAFDPAERPASAREVACDLGAFVLPHEETVRTQLAAHVRALGPEAEPLPPSGAHATCVLPVTPAPLTPTSAPSAPPAAPAPAVPWGWWVLAAMLWALAALGGWLAGC